MKRTKYTAEFKLEAVKQILEKGHSATDVARHLGVPVGLLYTWTRKLKGLDEKPIEDVKALQAGWPNSKQSSDEPLKSATS